MSSYGPCEESRSPPKLQKLPRGQDAGRRCARRCVGCRVPITVLPSHRRSSLSNSRACHGSARPLCASPPELRRQQLCDCGETRGAHTQVFPTASLHSRWTKVVSLHRLPPMIGSSALACKTSVTTAGACTCHQGWTGHTYELTWRSSSHARGQAQLQI